MVRSTKGVAYPFLKLWYAYIRKQRQKDLVQLMGMRRSGNHAIIHWLLPQIEGRICFNNNLGPHHPASRTPIKKAVWNRGSGHTLLNSFENKKLEDLLENYDFQQFGSLKQQYFLLLLRDPYNWLASYLAWPEEQGQKFRTDENYRQEIIENYKEYAAEFLRWQRGEKPGPHIYLAVNFNKWIKEKPYRENLAESLHLKFSDKGRDVVDRQGGGSSFSGTRVKGSELQVLGRYINFRDDEFYLDLLDEELREIGAEIFGYPRNFLL